MFDVKRGSFGVRRAVGVGAQALLLLTMPLCFDRALAQPAAEQSASSGVETMVVTARKREESLQNVPLSVTLLSSQALERQQVVSTTDLDKVAPNIQFHSYGTLTGNNSAAQVFIRGIGQTDATPAVDPGVGVYIDDVYMGRSVGAAMDFRDIANVQILRGPQGTLFGRNTIGGAVLLTTNQPGEDAGNTVRVGFGEDKLYEAFGAMDVPIVDTLDARVALGFRKRDGYVQRISDGTDLGNENMYTGQIALRWAPTSDLTFTVRADYTNEDENGSPFVFKAINETAVFPASRSVDAGCPGATFPPPFVPATATPDARCANDAWNIGPFLNGGTYPVSSMLENAGVSLVAEWVVNDHLTFKSITADRHLRWSGSRDADNTPLTILHTNYKSKSDQFSQEIQALLTTKWIDGVFGAYYFDEDSFDNLTVPLGNPPPPPVGPAGGSYDRQRVSLDTLSWALFTEMTFNITDALAATGGVRYTHETKGLQGTMFNVSPVGAPEPPAPAALCPFAGPPPSQTGCLFITTDRFEKSFSSVIGSASVQYRFNDALMTYFSWSQGFKSGGFNQRYNNAPPANMPIAFDEETAESYEFGFKSNPMPGLTINGALFRTKYDDIQMTFRLGVVPLLFNAGVAVIKGGELEVAFSPIDDLVFDGSVGYLNTGFDSITPPPAFGPIVPTATATLDSRLPFTPEWQAHFGASYSLHLTQGMQLTPRIDVSYTSPQFFDASNTESVAQNDPVTLVNGAISLESPNGTWRLTVSGNNLTNALYPVMGTSSETTATGYAEIIYARPRTVALTGSVRF